MIRIKQKTKKTEKSCCPIGCGNYDKIDRAAMLAHHLLCYGSCDAKAILGQYQLLVMIVQQQSISYARAVIAILGQQRIS